MKRKKKGHKKKSKLKVPNKRPTMQQMSDPDAYIHSWIELFIKASAEEILEGLLMSEDGRLTTYAYIPGIPEEIELDFRLEDSLGENMGHNKEVIRCNYH